MATGPVVKKLLRTAGSQLGGYLDKALKMGGDVGQAVATEGLNLGIQTFAPKMAGMANKDRSKFLRTSPQSFVPQAGRLIGQGATIGAAFALGNLADQQTTNTQPMEGGMEDFLQSQALQNQKFMHEMALIQNRAESRTPGAQFGGSLYDMARAEKELTDAGEITNREVLGVARSIYGTGFRA
jgi:hypothetical protein